ncbi:MAG: adenylate/guanylate cyclase domain-containing protein, partial [Acidimicrobiia bacterium]
MLLVAEVVTFVFTDIEGSTRLLATRTEAYPEIVQRHRAIITAEVEARGGRVLGHEGDSCFIVFDKSTEAIAAMAAAQRRLASEPWPHGVDVRVRMGIHTGPAERSGEDYYGLTVHTASRVADAAHGGQIVLSEAAVDAGLPENLSTKDLGVHRLKHLDTSVRLYQLTGEGLRADFPPPRALPSMARVRTPTTSFVGREAETAELLRLLETSRLVTLLGPGGIGKTRFAFHIATVGGDRFPDGVWFTDLTGID